MKQIIGEDPNYMERIKEYKSRNLKYQLNMRIEPCFFTVDNKKSMLSALRQAFELDLIRIHPSFDKLWQALHQCSGVEGIVEGKQNLPGNDVLDALFMVTNNYKR
jgi:hypothetical protein